MEGGEESVDNLQQQPSQKEQEHHLANLAKVLCDLEMHRACDRAFRRIYVAMAGTLPLIAAGAVAFYRLAPQLLSVDDNVDEMTKVFFLSAVITLSGVGVALAPCSFLKGMMWVCTVSAAALAVRIDPIAVSIMSALERVATRTPFAFCQTVADSPVDALVLRGAIAAAAITAGIFSGLSWLARRCPAVDGPPELKIMALCVLMLGVMGVMDMMLGGGIAAYFSSSFAEVSGFHADLAGSVVLAATLSVPVWCEAQRVRWATAQIVQHQQLRNSEGSDENLVASASMNLSLVVVAIYFLVAKWVVVGVV